MMKDAQKHTDQIQEGDTVRVTRHTTRQVNSWKSETTGQESFEGTVTRASDHGCFVKGDRKMQAVGTHYGTDHGSPVISVERIS